jgi:muramidase (phage lysozyme)
MAMKVFTLYGNYNGAIASETFMNLADAESKIQEEANSAIAATSYQIVEEEWTESEAKYYFDSSQDWSSPDGYDYVRSNYEELF